jgi:hypothetical protein
MRSQFAWHHAILGSSNKAAVDAPIHREKSTFERLAVHNPPMDNRYQAENLVQP